MITQLFDLVCRSSWMVNLLVATLQEWMQHYRYDGVAINLDPGSETVAYEAFLMSEKNLQFLK